MKARYTLFFFVLILLFSCKEKKTTITFHKSHEIKKQNAPFSDVVETSDFMFLSGQIGIDNNTRTIVNGGIKAETKQAIDNIKAVLQHHNLSLDNVVKCTVILKNIEDFAAFNSVYTNYFTNKPARTTFAVSGLALNAKIEIECIVAK